MENTASSKLAPWWIASMLLLASQIGLYLGCSYGPGNSHLFLTLLDQNSCLQQVGSVLFWPCSQSLGIVHWDGSAKGGDSDQSPSEEVASLQERGWEPYCDRGGELRVLVPWPSATWNDQREAGERVVTGQALGRAGNSGRSGAPHLNMHLQDSPEFNGGEGIPLEFCSYTAYDFGGDPKSAKRVERGMPTGRLRKQVVRH